MLWEDRISCKRHVQLAKVRISWQNTESVGKIQDQLGKVEHTRICNFPASVARKPGPSRVSDSQLSAETVVYESFVVIGELG